jgi:hypothetical protein
MLQITLCYRQHTDAALRVLNVNVRSAIGDPDAVDSRTKGSTLDDTLTGIALLAQPSFDANLIQLMLER